MTERVKAGIIGGTGYTSLALLEVLTRHKNVNLQFATTRQGKLVGKSIHKEHPNLLGLTDLKFSLYDPSNPALTEINKTLINQARECDVVFLGVPSGASFNVTQDLIGHHTKIIDMSSDFRLKDPNLYKEYYAKDHPYPDLLKEYVYGLPELHRQEIKKARYVACPGCNSTAMILAGYPLTKLQGYQKFTIVYNVMTGSSEAGAVPRRASHHSERSGVVRPYAVKKHRHLAEVRQELGFKPSKVSASMFAVPMVRGVECIGHVFPDRPIDERLLWKVFREAYRDEPFVRIRAKKTGGPGSLPDVKYVRGSNFCDVGFFIDKESGRIGVLSALDNLMKGDVGNAVQSMNIMFGLNEDTRLVDMVPSPLYE